MKNDGEVLEEAKRSAHNFHLFEKCLRYGAKRNHVEGSTQKRSSYSLYSRNQKYV